MSDNSFRRAQDIARGALKIEWWDTESAARRVAEYAADRIEALTAKLIEAEAQVDRLISIAEEAEARERDAYEKGLSDALGLIASLGYGKNEDVDRGHEDAYRAIEKHLEGWKTALPTIQPEQGAPWAQQWIEDEVKKMQGDK